jgi:hypothetical protein
VIVGGISATTPQHSPAFTTGHGIMGLKWLDDRVTTGLQVKSLGKCTVQQQVFGDIMKRQIVGEVRIGL